MDLQEAAIALDFLNTRVGVDTPYYYVSGVECMDTIIYNGYDIELTCSIVSGFRLCGFSWYTISF